MALPNKQSTNLGKRIKKFRRERVLSQEELASILRLSSVYLGYVEQGRRLPSIKTLNKIAKVLKTSTSELLRN